MAVGGVGIPAAVQQAAPPRRIQWGRGTLAGPRQWCRSDRGFTAAVGIPIGAPPACRRCSRAPPPWRSKTARLEMHQLELTLTLRNWSYIKAQLKQFCKGFDCPIKSSSRKEELQKALRVWVTAKSTEGHTEDEGDEEEEEECSVHNGIVGGPFMSRGKVSRAGSSVSSKGLTPEELQDRQAEKEYQLEQRRLALEERKSAMAHELSLREMDQRSQSSRDGGSNPTVQPERRVHIPKDLVKDYKREDDIYTCGSRGMSLLST
ncbi:hypothetical protein NDU88_001671 [Pleurodeles waltl]|uniref:Uncharacterized protein n=1 Tax=Pleurodeles waltl TaxID=8319 RepID=A0AAV7RB09_PLEWA|nr:hypothetical protein NDU88_001671 [Pleurodeles waltl]